MMTDPHEQLRELCHALLRSGKAPSVSRSRKVTLPSAASPPPGGITTLRIRATTLKVHPHHSRITSKWNVRIVFGPMNGFLSVELGPLTLPS
jgi:hypothetical protein